MRTRALVIHVAVVLTFVAPCWADNRASEWTSRGIEQYTHGDYSGAREAFARAYEAAPTTAGLLNLALAEVQSGHALAAARHLRTYLMDPNAEPETVHAIRATWLPRAEAEIGRLAIHAPRGAEISVDGRAQGSAPFQDSIAVSAGQHEVAARLGPWSQTVRAAPRPGEVLAVQFQTIATPASAAVAVAAEHPPAGATAGPPRAKLVTVALVAVSAAAATGLGAAFAVYAKQDADEASTLRSALASGACAPPSPAPSCPSLARAVQYQDQNVRASIGSYVAGGALAAGAVALWLCWPSTSTKATTAGWSLAPHLGGRTAGVLLERLF
jgi:hypothetical protein